MRLSAGIGIGIEKLIPVEAPVAEFYICWLTGPFSIFTPIMTLPPPCIDGAKLTLGEQSSPTV
jgi:hypothetical protein